MDTVEGIKDKKEPVLLTLEIVEIKFFMAFIIESQTQIEVINKLSYIKNTMTDKLFNILFEILLTDNGKEFSNPELFLELSNNIHIFFCHSYSSYEKGSIENTHEFVRRVIPKGISLKVYNQNDITLLCNHINSLYRKELDGLCPFDLIDKYIPKKTLDELGYNKISDYDIRLIPELLGEKNIKNINKYLTKDMIKKQNIILKNN